MSDIDIVIVALLRLDPVALSPNAVQTAITLLKKMRQARDNGSNERFTGEFRRDGSFVVLTR